MDDLPLPQEADDIVDVGVVGHAQDVVIGNPGLLFGGHILGQIADHVALHRHGGGVPGEAGGGSGVDSGGVVYKVGGKAALPYLLIVQVAGQLVDDGADHLQVAQFLSTYIGVKMAPRG